MMNPLASQKSSATLLFTSATSDIVAWNIKYERS
jgi:hypothetical protein